MKPSELFVLILIWGTAACALFAHGPAPVAYAAQGACAQKGG